MKRLLITIAALTCATNVNAENLIRWLLTRDVKKSDFYVYRPKAASQPIVKHPDNKPVKRVIDKHRESDETAAKAVSKEKQVMYGAGSPMRDDGVIQAWREAEEAQRRLEEHRTYMEQVRQARKRIEQTKSVSGKVIQTP